MKSTQQNNSLNRIILMLSIFGGGFCTKAIFFSWAKKVATNKQGANVIHSNLDLISISNTVHFAKKHVDAISRTIFLVEEMLRKFKPKKTQEKPAPLARGETVKISHQNLRILT